MKLTTRLLAAGIAAALAAILCFNYSLASQRGAGDFGMATCMARSILNREDPYAICRGVHSDGVTQNQANPLTTALLALPFVTLTPSLAAGIFFGIISGLLAYASTRESLSGLLVFIAFPYWQALQTVQWSPLLVAVGLIPALLPFALAKPHVALPIFITQITWRRLLGCLAFLALTFVIDPTWPWRLTGRIPTPGDYLPPLLTLPLGPLLIISAARWRTARGRLLLLLACTPQRLFYDVLLLWLIPRTRREYLIMGVCSWCSYFGWFFMPQAGIAWVIAGIYLPALALIWRDPADIGNDPRLALRGWWQQIWQR